MNLDLPVKAESGRNAGSDKPHQRHDRLGRKEETNYEETVLGVEG
jgi:hypothetical protein